MERIPTAAGVPNLHAHEGTSMWVTEVVAFRGGLDTLGRRTSTH